MNRDGRARLQMHQAQPFGGGSEMDSTWPRHVMVTVGSAPSPGARPADQIERMLSNT